MTQLLILDQVSQHLDETSFGGLPVKTIGLQVEWPCCTNCDGAMQYLGKVKTDLGLELIFMCSQDPGMCDDWDADGGGNKVIVITEIHALEKFQPLEPENTLRETEYGAKIFQDSQEEYSQSRELWQGPKREILGQLSGSAEWLQNDETPECDCCQKPMRFVAQLETGPDHRTEMNFGGGGSAYLFDCPQGKTAKFLWQC